MWELSSETLYRYLYMTKLFKNLIFLQVRKFDFFLYFFDLLIFLGKIANILAGDSQLVLEFISNLAVGMVAPFQILAVVGMTKIKY